MAFFFLVINPGGWTASLLARGQNQGGAAQLAPLFTPTVDYWEPEIAAWAETYGLDANLIATVIQIESCGSPEVVSSAGALGLFQVMPFHFNPGEQPFEPETNAQRGLEYLEQALEQTQGDVSLALAGYNGGLSIMDKGRETWPAETLRYSAWGEQIYEDAQKGLKHSPALQDWLAHGGARLCLQAWWDLLR